jgi:S1-C subfamily serine protease
MKVSLGILSACLGAASILAPAAGAQTAPAPPPAPAQPAPPRARSAQAVIVQRDAGYLGIGGVEVTPEKARALNLKEERGVLVSSVAEDGPAAKAGIAEGDVVLDFNGTAVEGTVQFQRLVRETPPGRPVKITVWRNGAPVALNVTIGARKAGAIAPMAPGDMRSWSFEMPNMPNLREFRMPEMNIPPFESFSPNPVLGIYGEPMGEAEQLAEYFGVTGGVLVRSVLKGSSAEKAGIKAGDVITKVDDTHISNSADITRALRALRGSKKTSVNVTVVRNHKEMSMAVTLETPAAGNVRAMLYVPGYNFFPVIP